MLAIHAIVIAPYDLRVTIIEPSINGLDASFDGYTLAVIADLHYWPSTDRRHLDRITGVVRGSNADLIVLLGDYSRSFGHFRHWWAPLYRNALRSLEEPLSRCTQRDGIIAVLGNHDHYFNAPLVAEWLESIGATLLTNDHIVLRRGAARLIVSGVGDALEDEVDPRAGLGDAVSEAPLVVLSHNPDGVLKLDPAVRPALVLSGHTHGGQVVVPGYGAPVTFTQICGRRTASGWVPNPIAPLFVTRGAGSQIPLRFCCPPEVLIVRLRMPGSQQPA
jgi:predicted MPP superfamily phosphohydrolase